MAFITPKTLLTAMENSSLMEEVAPRKAFGTRISWFLTKVFVLMGYK